MCSEHGWAKGFYWLRSITVENYAEPELPIAKYSRYYGTVTYEGGPSGNHDLHLDRQDFFVQ